MRKGKIFVQGMLNGSLWVFAAFHRYIEKDHFHSTSVLTHTVTTNLFIRFVLATRNWNGLGFVGYMAENESEIFDPCIIPP